MSRERGRTTDTSAPRGNALACLSHLYSGVHPVASRVGKFVVLAALLLAAGCGPARIDSTYGKRRGTSGGASVNGTAVLAGMFEDAGHRVTSWRRLSPKLEQCQTIVWFPDSFEPPTQEQRVFLEWWLDEESGRTLIYVGRDYDAEITYWQTIQPSAPPGQFMEVARRLATAQAEHDAARSSVPKEEQSDWFTLKRDHQSRRPGELSGPWTEGIDLDETRIELASRLAIPTDEANEAWYDQDYNLWDERPRFRSLLRSGEEPIITELTVGDWGHSKIILVNNGSFLLNLPLVNHEHRKLAGKLVSACGPGRVVFLESGPSGPPVFDEEPGANVPSGFGAFTVWPLGFILMHFAILGILCCVALFPIFGRAKDARPDAAGTLLASGTGAATVVRADFGRHIEALGELLELTQDRNYARSRIEYYHQHVKRDSGSAVGNR